MIYIYRFDDKQNLSVDYKYPKLAPNSRLNLLLIRTYEWSGSRMDNLSLLATDSGLSMTSGMSTNA